MKKYFPSVLLISVILIIFSCESTQKIDKDALAEEKRSREIKKLSQLEITEAAFILGRSMTMKAKGKFQILIDSICKGEHIIEPNINCEARGLSEIDPRYFTKNCIINRYTINSRGLNNEESQLLEAYMYNSENSLSQTDNIQKMTNAYLYTQPILFKDLECILCLENPVVSFSPDQLAGMWSVTIPSKELIIGI